MGLTLVTHHRPHIDDICGMWLLARYWKPAKEHRFAFVSSKERDPGDPARVWVGVGRGRFDEHKGDLGESATSLVFRFVREERKDLKPGELNALTRLVTWVRDEDMGLHDEEPERPFGPTAFLRSHFDLNGRDSATVVSFCLAYLDDVFEALRMEERLAEDWEARNEFESPWGHAVALETTAYAMDEYAYRRGFALVVFVNPKTGFRGFRAAPKSAVDLTAAYEALRRADAKTDWYLHHSRKLLLAGSDVAPDSKLSRLTLQDLVRVLEPVPGKE